MYTRIRKLAPSLVACAGLLAAPGAAGPQISFAGLYLSDPVD